MRRPFSPAASGGGTSAATSTTTTLLLLFVVVACSVISVASAQDSDDVGDGGDASTYSVQYGDADASTTRTTNATNTTASDTTIIVDYPPASSFPKPTPKSRHITVDEWENFLKSESGIEFAFNDDPIKARLEWDDAIEFEWGRCLVEESLQPREGAERKRCTYILCHSGEGMSGWGRKKELIDFIIDDDAASDADGAGGADGGGAGNVTSSEETEEEDRYIKASALLQTIYSADDVWCGYSRMHASKAQVIRCSNPDDCLVTPLMYSMKMMPNTITRLLDAIEELYGQSDLTELEDGSGGEMRKKLRAEREEKRRRKRNKNKGGSGADGEVYEDVNANRDSRTIQGLPKVDFHLCPGVIDEDDVRYFTGGGGDPATIFDDPASSAAAEADASDLDLTEFMTQWLLARVGSADSDAGGDDDGGNGTVGVGMEANYWTSSRAAHLRSHNDTTGRGRFWEDVFKLTLKTTVCVPTYTRSLIWRADLRPSPESSVITGAYDDKVDPGRAIDQWCIVALVASLSTLTEVCAVEIRPELEVQNVYAQWLVQSGLVDERPWFDHGLDGRGEVVAVSDTGLDQDNCYFRDAVNGPVGEKRDNSQRKVVQYLPFVDTADYEYGHGTHVAGTVCGKRAVNGINETTGMADGVAPGAKVAFLDLGSSDGYLSLPRDTFTLSTGRDALPLAHIHSASWGSVGVNYYSTQARNFDEYMYRHDDFLINVAAGNDGRGDTMNSVSSPATFKNGLAVGASHSAGDNLKFHQFGPSYLADFTSRGPTADGRIAPMVVAPGKYVLSAGALPDESGECDGIRPGTSGGENGLKSMAGTSMATPVVSGTAAMVRQYFREGWYPSGTKREGDGMEVSGMLVKAVLMNGAQTRGMKGVDNGGGRVTPIKAYDNNMGFGRIDLIKSLYIEGWSDVQAEVWDRQVVQDGVVKPYTVTIDRSRGCEFTDLSVTLVWVEKPSVIGCNKCVVNDLDLYLTDPSGTKFYPNDLNGPDRTNNAERVVVPSVEHGSTYTIHVHGYNFDDYRQTYALVATGCFGGVKNTLDTSKDAFVSDNSATDRRNTIIIVVCSIVGGILFWCLCLFGYKKRVESKNMSKRAEAEAAAAEAGMEAQKERAMTTTEGGGGDEKGGMKNEEDTSEEEEGDGGHIGETVSTREEDRDMADFAHREYSA